MKVRLYMVKIADAYWIDPSGKIYEVNKKHIDFLRDNLQKFNLSEEDYFACYRKHSEPFGFEGKARQELFVIAFKSGWIRLRHKANFGWTIEFWDYDEKTKHSIMNWAGEYYQAHSGNESLKHERIDLHILKLNLRDAPRELWSKQMSFSDFLTKK